MGTQDPLRSGLVSGGHVSINSEEVRHLGADRNIHGHLEVI